jgi:hypothetical protein
VSRSFPVCPEHIIWHRTIHLDTTPCLTTNQHTCYMHNCLSPWKCRFSLWQLLQRDTDSIL